MKYNDIDISRFLDADGKITFLPKKRDKRDAVLAYLASKFEMGRDYKEREINAIIDAWHTFSDLFILRREMIEAGALCRTTNGARYWRPEADPTPDANPAPEIASAPEMGPMPEAEASPDGE